jgi:hypothetical protein
MEFFLYAKGFTMSGHGIIKHKFCLYVAMAVSYTYVVPQSFSVHLLITQYLLPFVKWLS